MRLYTKTFGCRVNQYETEGVKEKLLADGVSVATSDYESADLCVVNTCTVTGEADKDAFQLMRRISRRNPAARLVVTGCLATRDPEAVRTAAPGATIVSNEDKQDIPAMLGCQSAPEYAGIRGYADRSRAFVKVQDGCNMHCTYCIIPSVRPNMTTKPIAELEREIQTLTEGGYGEIVLCGVRLGRYLTVDESGRRVDFCAMLERLLRVQGDFRIRLSSFEITDITERFLDLFEKADGKIAPSFHLPLQSGSQTVLERMKRWYSTRFYARRIAALRARGVDVGLFTDLMVGFPGESDAEFEESEAFVREMGFDGLHVFRYSDRSGTPAAEGTGHLEAGVLKARAERMRALDRGLREAFARRHSGQRRRILVEARGSRVEGTTEHFLRVSLDRKPDAALAWARLGAAEGAAVSAVVE
jgi:threonylcarbamoyladenosine tRNA methylthiotransferase MtaB